MAVAPTAPAGDQFSINDSQGSASNQNSPAAKLLAETSNVKSVPQYIPAAMNAYFPLSGSIFRMANSDSCCNESQLKSGNRHLRADGDDDDDVGAAAPSGRHIRADGDEDDDVGAAGPRLRDDGDEDDDVGAAGPSDDDEEEDDRGASPCAKREVSVWNLFYRFNSDDDDKNKKKAFRGPFASDDDEEEENGGGNNRIANLLSQLPPGMRRFAEMFGGGLFGGLFSRFSSGGGCDGGDCSQRMSARSRIANLDDGSPSSSATGPSWMSNPSLKLYK